MGLILMRLRNQGGQAAGNLQKGSDKGCGVLCWSDNVHYQRGLGCERQSGII